ncbi:MAG: orotate phosphoribosyltransferase [bacterium]
MKEQLIDLLVSIGAVKFGEFKLKSGIISPIYLDLRIIISYPEILKRIASELLLLSQQLQFDRIAGIPYTALPIATAFSLASDYPMIYCRKERKAYGTGKMIEGVWDSGDQVLIIDDLITNGDSKLETFKIFIEAGLRVRDVIVLIDREQGGKEKLQAEGYALHSAISIFEILERMRHLKQIGEMQYNNICEFLQKEK